MSFEPKLFSSPGDERPDRDDGDQNGGDQNGGDQNGGHLDAAPMPDDWQLPAELQQLGDQLRLDARKLAAQYPATPVSPIGVSPGGDSSVGKRAQAGRWTKAVAGLLASGLVLAALGAAGRVLEWRRGASSVARESASSVPYNGVVVVPAGDAASPSSNEPSKPDAGSVGVGLSAGAPGAGNASEAGDGRGTPTPVMFLQEVSGPELEGLLDLLEDDSGAARNISI